MEQNGNYNQPYQNNGNYNNYNNYNYNNGNMQWQNPAPQYTPVRDVFCNLLLVIFILQLVLGIVMMHSLFSGIDYRSLLDGSYVYQAYNSTYMVCTMISLLLSIGMIVFFVLDIVGISKAGCKILGLILFAIFFRPGYYIWRAHVLNRKKTFPVIYTIVYCLLLIGYVIFVVAEVMQMISSFYGYLY